MAAPTTKWHCPQTQLCNTEVQQQRRVTVFGRSTVSTALLNAITECLFVLQQQSINSFVFVLLYKSAVLLQNIKVIYCSL